MESPNLKKESSSDKGTVQADPLASQVIQVETIPLSWRLCQKMKHVGKIITTKQNIYLFTRVSVGLSSLELVQMPKGQKSCSRRGLVADKGRRKQRETCHNEFPVCIPPYDLALRHYERWCYPDPGNQQGPCKVSHKETKVLPRCSGKLH